MHEIWFWSLISVFVVSLISFIGVFSLSIRVEKLKKILIYLLAFSAGALLGDAFIHLLPEAVEKAGFSISLSAFVLLGILIFFILEKVIHWRHCHMPIDEKHGHVHGFAYTNLFGDSLHNFIDGLIIAGSYIISIPVGFATTIAVILHEIPQEIGDFGILLHAGFSRARALVLNFATALTAILGVVVALLLRNYIENIELFLVAIAVGGFIYIAGSDLIPELHKETKIEISFLQVIAFILGILVMALLLLIG